MLITEERRIAAYAVCVRAGRILLVHWVYQGEAHWTLPGGGIEHGEDPVDTVIREVAEETSCTATVIRLLGVHSVVNRYPRGADHFADQHALHILYEVELDGEARAADLTEAHVVAWIPIDELNDLPCSSQVDTSVDLWRHRPPRGRMG